MGGEAGALAQSSETSKYVYVVHQIANKKSNESRLQFQRKISLCECVSQSLCHANTRDIHFFFLRHSCRGRLCYETYK